MEAASQETQKADVEVRAEGGGQSCAQWRLLFLVTHSLVTSKAGRQHVLVGRKHPPLQLHRVSILRGGGGQPGRHDTAPEKSVAV